MRVEIDTTDLERYAQGCLTAADLLPRELMAGVADLKGRIEYIGGAELRAVTPVGHWPDGAGEQPSGFQPGRLRESTTAISQVEGTTLTTEYVQPAQNNGFQYARAVLGGRRAIDGHDYGHPLRTPWGPRWSVRASKPNDYPALAIPPITTALSLLAERWSAEVMNRLLETS